MSGVAYAVSAGIGFGIFQAVNRRANQQLDAYRATFLLLVVGALAMVLFSLATRDLSVLATAPPQAFLFFTGAVVVHCFLGWTFLSLSQQQVGAATTGAVLGTTPLVGSIMAALVLGEELTVTAGIGILLAVAGVATLSLRRRTTAAGEFPWFALLAALSWGSSPLFIRWGLEGLDDPIIGVTFGLMAAALVYAFALGVTRRRRAAEPISGEALRWITAAGILVAIGIACQWMAFDLIAVAVAITVMQLSAPTVITVAPFVVKSEVEKPTPALILGTAAVLAGSILVVLTGTG